MKDNTKLRLLRGSAKILAIALDHSSSSVPRPLRKLATQPLRKYGSRAMASFRSRPTIATSLTSLFDEKFYLSRYPDVHPNVIDPFLHYLVYGQREDRAPRRELDVRFPGRGFIDLDGWLSPSAKPKIMFVLHEATVTGAPMLGLELLRHLARTFDPYLVFMRGGPLLSEFLQYCVTATITSTADLPPGRSTPHRAHVSLPSKFEYVIANTVVAGDFLSTFDRDCSKAIVSLIHEYPTLDWLPLHDATVRNSDLVVYSSTFVRDATVEALGSPGILNSRVFPQGKIPYEAIRSSRHQNNGYAGTLLRQWTGKRLIVGCGTVDYRKGVDIFITTAELIAREADTDDVHFIWLGALQNESAYHSMLRLQLAHSKVRSRFTFLDHLDNPNDLIDRAAVFLLTSRMDPLPNVALDALYGGTPVICFMGAGGIPDLIDDLSTSAGTPVGYVVPYADASQMARMTVEVLASRTGEARREASTTAVRAALSMERYVERLLATLQEAKERRIHTLTLIRQLHANGLSEAEEYVRSWSTGSLGKLKPIVGFNPGEVAERNNFAWEPVESYPRHLRASLPLSWGIPRQTLTRSTRPFSAVPSRVALHVHVFYDYLLDEILLRLQSNATTPDLYFSASDEETAARAWTIAAERGFTPKETTIHPNRGRDVWPFLELSMRIADHYDFVGHVHTKDSLHISDRQMVSAWRTFLLENTIGGRFPTLDLIVDRMSIDPSIAIAFPDDPHAVGWTTNLELGEALLATMGWSGRTPSYFEFPVGTMFWASQDLLRLLNKLQLSLDQMPPEPLPTDGTLLHAIERVLGIIPPVIARSSMTVRMPGTGR